jgi:hypothetical protein
MVTVNTVNTVNTLVNTLAPYDTLKLLILSNTLHTALIASPILMVSPPLLPPPFSFTTHSGKSVRAPFDGANHGGSLESERKKHHDRRNGRHDTRRIGQHGSVASVFVVSVGCTPWLPRPLPPILCT